MDWKLTADAKAIFESLLDSGPVDRAARVREACAGDRVLQLEVESLLREQERSAGFLEEPLTGCLAANDGLMAMPPQVGPYEVGREIGRGGMGVVYEARRSDGLYEKTVALKMVDRAHCTPATEAAFRRELRVLSRLDHPHVVRLLDGGVTPGGLFYMVMEYVEGEPLDAYCRARTLDIAGRVRLFDSVCEVVAFAHRQLVVHRDLKPPNILVTADGIPKLLDFGVAMVLEEGGMPRVTRESRMTIEFASPEQVRGGSALSTATDIYSLGVILFELLTGRLPYAPESVQPHDLARAIVDEEPLRPRSVAAGIPRELEAIVLKALRKEPQQRYASVDQFRHDLGRYLNGGRISAFDGSLWYTARRILKRRRAAVTIFTIFGITVAAGAIESVWYARRADAYLTGMLEMEGAFLRQATLRPVLKPETLTEIEQHKAVLMDLARSARGSDAVKLRLVNLLLVLGNLQGHPTGPNFGNTAAALETLQEAIRIAADLYRRSPRNGDYAAHLTAVRCAAGTMLVEMNRYPEALEQFTAAVKLNANVAPRDPYFVSRRISYADAIANVSRVRLYERNERECLRLRAEAVAIRRAVIQPRTPVYRTEVGGALATYGWALRDFGHYDEALRAYEESNRLADEGIASGDLSNPVLLLLKAHNAEQLSRIHAALHQGSDARLAAQQCVDLFRKLETIEPNDAAGRRGLAVALALLAERQAENREPKSVYQPNWREALQLGSAAAANDPANQKCKEELNAIRATGAKLNIMR